MLKNNNHPWACKTDRKLLPNQRSPHPGPVSFFNQLNTPFQRYPFSSHIEMSQLFGRSFSSVIYVKMIYPLVQESLRRLDHHIVNQPIRTWSNFVFIVFTVVFTIKNVQWHYAIVPRISLLKYEIILQRKQPKADFC